MARPEHVEESEAGTSCRHCGGVVDDDGFSLSLGDEVSPDEDTSQDEAAEELHDDAFANALGKRANGRSFDNINSKRSGDN